MFNRENDTFRSLDLFLRENIKYHLGCLCHLFWSFWTICCRQGVSILTNDNDMYTNHNLWLCQWHLYEYHGIGAYIIFYGNIFRELIKNRYSWIEMVISVTSDAIPSQLTSDVIISCLLGNDERLPVAAGKRVKICREKSRSTETCYITNM